MTFFGIFAPDRRRLKVQGFLTKLINQLTMPRTADENRDDSRVSATLSARIIPRDPSGRRLTEHAFDAVTRDVNVAGVSFAHRRHFCPGDRLDVIVEVEGIERSLGCEVLHSTPIGHMFFVTGCKILDVEEAGR